MSVRRSAVAPPAVAARSASDGVMCMSRTAIAMQNGIDEVNEDPGLQSVPALAGNPGFPATLTVTVADTRSSVEVPVTLTLG